MFMAAERADKERNYVKALDMYLAVLEQEPLHVRSLCRAAELYYKRGQYSTALEFASQALRQSMYDPEANYIYGIISRRIENKVDALETLGWASRSLKFRSAAYVQMAEIYIGDRNYELALEYAHRALDFNQYNISAMQAVVVIFRMMGDAGAAREVLERLESIDPLNHFIRYELYLLYPDSEKLQNFQSAIQNEFPHETYLETALYYDALKCRKEAVDLLRLSPEQPTVCYWLAYLLKDTSPEESRIWLEKAEGLSSRLVFPFRLETIPVFQWAANSHPELWKPKYYLGLIYWSKGRDNEALDLFKDCGRPEFVPLYLIRAHLMKKRAPQEALDDLHAAVQLDGKDWRARHALTDYYLVEEDTKNALASAMKAQEALPLSSVIQIDMVKAYMLNEKYGEAADILDKLDILPHEGAADVHGLFEVCQLKLAFNAIKLGDFAKAIVFLEKSKTYPERLGSGEPFFPDHRRQNYLIALCYENLGESDKVLRVKREIYEYTQHYGAEYGVDDYFGGLILQEYGDKDTAEKLFKKSKPEKDIQEIIVLLKKQNKE
jgi:tetratricopeptide (TPR) repeat protein